MVKNGLFHFHKMSIKKVCEVANGGRGSAVKRMALARDISAPLQDQQRPSEMWDCFVCRDRRALKSLEDESLLVHCVNINSAQFYHLYSQSVDKLDGISTLVAGGLLVLRVRERTGTLPT